MAGQSNRFTRTEGLAVMFCRAHESKALNLSLNFRRLKRMIFIFDHFDDFDLFLTFFFVCFPSFLSSRERWPARRAVYNVSEAN